MTDLELKDLIKEFIAMQDDSDYGEWWTTMRGIAEEVMEDFEDFLKRKRKER